MPSPWLADLSLLLSFTPADPTGDNPAVLAQGMRMDRRTFNCSLAAAVSAPLLSEQLSAGEKNRGRDDSSAAPLQIGMLLYPGMYALDLVGPHAFLAGLPNVTTHLLWKTLEPVPTLLGMHLSPTSPLSACPQQLDVLFVPGGTPGTIALMQDNEVLDFLADRGERARYVTSVCTGSLILGAAGLLRGYRATSHWQKRDLLSLLGAVPDESRIVEDRNRITGGGVTSGIDFGLMLASRLRGGDAAKLQQLLNEYDPQPPLNAGTPGKAGPELTAQATQSLSQGYAQSRAAALIARKRLGLS
jgi:cyclohexyl-isocyanide hydratase